MFFQKASPVSDEKQTTDPKSKPKNSKFINTIESGITRLDFKETSEEYIGLYTEGLNTCIAIIIIGSRGISLIHDTVKLDPKDIQKEFKWVGTVKEWTTAFYPHAEALNRLTNPFFKESLYPNGIFGMHYIRLMDLAAEIDSSLKSKYTSPKGSEFHGAVKFFVSVKRDGTINTEQKPTEIISPPNSEIRLMVNRINTQNTSKVSSLDNKPVRADLQFDGDAFTKSSTIEVHINDTLQITGSVSAEVRGVSELFVKQLTVAFQKKYKQPRDKDDPTLATILRRASAAGELMDVINLTQLLDTPAINCQDDNPKSGRTALHWSIINSHTWVTAELRKKGARDNIPDKKNNKTARQYEQELQQQNDAENESDDDYSLKHFCLTM